jgi:hypothetical protein
MAAKKNVLGAAMLFGFALFAAGNTADGTTQSSPNAATVLQQKGLGMLVFVLSEESGDTIADANLKVAMIWEKNPPWKIINLKTNELGFCRVEFGELRPVEMHLTVSKGGRVGMASVWKEDKNIPEEYTFRLEKGTVIGGRVVNEQGDPVAGAIVELSSCSWEDLSEKAKICIRETVKTDADGKWSVDTVPTDLEQVKIDIGFSHPDYPPEQTFRDLRTQATIPTLRSQKAIFVLQRGLAISGRVIDTNGNAVSGAWVKFGHDLHVKELKTQTDSSGNFKFNAQPLRRRQMMWITVEADTYAPDAQYFDANVLMKPIEFVLGPGRHISGRIVDVNGSPLEGVQIGVSQYQLDWRTVTGQDGRFEWHNAPADRFEIWVKKDGYMCVSQSVVATEKECKFVLYKPFRVMGKVVNADTSEPIDKFDLTARILYKQGQSEVKHSQHTDGRFDIILDTFGPEYEVEVKADGYAPSTSRRFTPGEGTVELQIRMARAARENIPQGTIYLPDGNIAPGAEVYVATGLLRLEESRKVIRGGKEYVRTDSAGRFTAAVQSEKFKLFAIHENGYAEVNQEQLAESSDIHLKPWGRVEGTVRTRSGPVAYAQVLLSPEPLRMLRDPQRIEFSYTSGTDANGRFVIDRVVPGRMRVRRVTLDENGMKMAEGEGASKLVEVVPGETAFVELVAGRTIAGKLVVSDKITGFRGWDSAIGSIDDLWIDRETLQTTYEYETMPQQQKNQQRENLRDRAGQKQVWKSGGKSLVFRFFSVGSDGSFHIDDVHPGNHELKVNISGLKADANGTTTYPIGYVRHQFTMPETGPNQEDEPLDLGVIAIEPVIEPFGGRR